MLRESFLIAVHHADDTVERFGPYETVELAEIALVAALFDQTNDIAAPWRRAGDVARVEPIWPLPRYLPTP